MKTYASSPTVQKPMPTRRPKDAIIRSRCSTPLRDRLVRIATVKEVDLSDVIRDACQSYALQFEQRVA